MNTEITISAADAGEALRLIQEYLFEGGTGFSAEALERAADALGNADRIVIQSECNA
jgi:hypothetical protein